jgi:hypothetical protein
LVTGVKNNGWCCDGSLLLPGGCLTGLGLPKNSYDAKGYFDPDGDISLCDSCFERIEKDDELPTWYGYSYKGGMKIPFKLEKFLILKNKIRGYGSD